MVATAGDYLRFSEMMLHGGMLGNTRLVSPTTVALMTADALPPGLAYLNTQITFFEDMAPTPAMGQGFGLGFAVRTAPGRNVLPGSVGTYFWAGGTGTTFWIDPKEKLIGIMMLQAPLAKTGLYRRAMRNLTYQAFRGTTQ
jgi:CubicO group peptidase (beta-lactamase class C family)